MKAKMKKRISVFTLMVFCLGVFPTAGLAVDVDPSVGDYTAIGNNSLTAGTYYLTTADGGITDDGTKENFNILLQKTENGSKLILNNATISQTLYVEGGTTIELNGTNNIGKKEKPSTTGIQIITDPIGDTALHITGDGKISIYPQSNSEGIVDSTAEEAGAIVIDSGKIIIGDCSTPISGSLVTICGDADIDIDTTHQTGISGTNNITIADSAKVDINSEGTCLYSSAGTVVIEDNADVDLKSSSGLISGNNGFTVSDNANIVGISTSNSATALNSFEGPVYLGGTVSVEFPESSSGVLLSNGQSWRTDARDITLAGKLTFTNGYVGIGSSSPGILTIENADITLNNIQMAFRTRNGVAADTTGGNLIIKDSIVNLNNVGYGIHPNDANGIASTDISNSTINISATTLGIGNSSPLKLTNSTVTISSFEGTALSQNDNVTLNYDNGYEMLAGDSEAAATIIPTGSETSHYTDHYVKISPKKVISAESVSLNTDTLLLYTNKDPQQATLIATVLPEGATDPITWSTSNPTVATVENGVVTAVGEGTATITVTVGGKTATCEVTVETAEPPYTGKYSYEISVDESENGTLSVDRYATEGDKVTIEISPDEAYLLEDLTITSGGKEVEVTENGDGTYSFTMPSGDVEISATFAEDPDWTEPEPEPEPSTDVSEIFVDVAPDAWYKDAVQYAYDNGLMTGVSATEFAPDATTTRAMIVSILARLEGVTSASDAGFSDVDDEWFATAANWAASESIVAGFEDGSFRPNDAITREQLAAILMNYAVYKGEDVSARAALDAYSDADAVSSWAAETMSWAVAEGYISGMTADELQPQGNATRAQVAAIFQRYLEK